MICIAIFVLMAILAPIVAPYDPTKTGLGPTLSPPSPVHQPGLDKLGRDELSRVLCGRPDQPLDGRGLGDHRGDPRWASSVRWQAASAGWVDTILMRFVDVLLSIPGILLAIGIVAWLGQGLGQIMIAVAVANSPIFARLREAACSPLARRNSSPPPGRVGASRARLADPSHASEFIDRAHRGCNARPGDGDHRRRRSRASSGSVLPTRGRPEWGTMLTDSTEALRRAPNLIFAPAIAIVISAIGFNLFGDGLRESLDPRLKR